MDESSSSRQPVEGEIEEEEVVVEETPSNSLMSRLTRFSESVASTSIGQYAIKKIDNVLWTVEKTAKWSLPQYTKLNYNSSEKEEGELDDSQEKIKAPPLTRPLPWLFFIPMLIALRMTRTGLSVGALLLRKSPVTPVTMVSFVQSRRRKLRAIKYTGLRNIRMRYIEAAEERRNGRITRRSIGLRLRNLFTLVLCGNYGEIVSPVKMTVKNRKEKTSTKNERKKRHVEDSDDEELGCEKLMEKYANEDDSDDLSFESENISSSDITISDDESETDNILNKTMNEKDSPKYSTPKYRKPRSQPNSGSSAKASEPINTETSHTSTPKRSLPQIAVPKEKSPENEMLKNGENGHHKNTEETKMSSPVKGQSSPKDTENSEVPESINNLPESQRNEVNSSSPKIGQ